MKDDPSLESHLEKLFQSLDDPRATEQEWYEQAEAVYQAISRSDASQAGRDHSEQCRSEAIACQACPTRIQPLSPIFQKKLCFFIIQNITKAMSTV